MEKVKIKGVIYRYCIDEENRLQVRGIVSYQEFEAIKERLIKKGKYVPKNNGTWSEEFLKKRFEKWSNVELKLQMEDLKNGEKAINEDEKFKDQVEAELKRRGVSDDK